MLIELFTSQGCNTCPPADAFLGELSERPDVIALALHVDYWDYLGWKDRFAKPVFTERQRGYAVALGARQVYTPQIVVHGGVGLVGSHRDAVNMAIESIAPRVQDPLVDITLIQQTDGLTIKLSPTRDLSAIRLPAPISVIIMGYNGPHVQEIAAGENGGKELIYHNVVADYRVVAEWTAEAQSITVTIDPALKGYVALLQHRPTGAVFAVEQLEF